MTVRRSVPAVLAASILLVVSAALPGAEVKPSATSGFTVTLTLTVPGSPPAVYDLITGDISPWWDHTFSEKPAELYIEARPGGGFYEIFNDTGDGARHATVITAERGKLLRFDGPLGLSGHALQMVHTLTFEASGADSTRIDFTLNAAGQVQEGWPEVVERTWKHFLLERFQPYAAGKLGGKR